MVISKEGDLTAITITVEKKAVKFLKKKGVNRSRFFRQACIAYRDGKFEYSHVDEDESDLQ